jgi:hypothetical protein
MGYPTTSAILAERIAVVAAAVTAPSPSGSRLEWAKTPSAASLSPDG